MILSAAWGLGAQTSGSEDGPMQLKHAGLDSFISRPSYWQTLLRTSNTSSQQSRMLQLRDLCMGLSMQTADCVAKNQPFLVLGGDHSCALGSWAGVLAALPAQQPFGLLWLDAHMDAHTIETSHSKNPHGMPLAYLLGQGEQGLFFGSSIKRYLDPTRVCLLGVRSFEVEEEQLLSSLGVQVFKMDDIKQQGLNNIFNKAFKIIGKGKSPYGVSIDIDGFDPKQAPGTGAPVSGGLDVLGCCQALSALQNDPHLVGVEIAEYDPSRDRDNLTQQVICSLVKHIFN
jgi:arginase